MQIEIYFAINEINKINILFSRCSLLHETCSEVSYKNYPVHIVIIYTKYLSQVRPTRFRGNYGTEARESFIVILKLIYHGYIVNMYTYK